MEKLILSEDEVSRICDRLGEQLDENIKKSNNGIPVFVGVMNGALPFMYELIKHVKSYIVLDTIKVSSYNGTETTGDVLVQKEPDHNLEGRDVYLVEDIIDTGITMHFLKEFMKKKYKIKNLYVCIFVKRNTDKCDYNEIADFTGLTTDETKYILGYGFDYHGLNRNQKYVYVPSEKDFEEWDNLLQEDAKLHPNNNLLNGK